MIDPLDEILKIQASTSDLRKILICSSKLGFAHMIC